MNHYPDPAQFPASSCTNWAPSPHPPAPLPPAARRWGLLSLLPALVSLFLVVFGAFFAEEELTIMAVTLMPALLATVFAQRSFQLSSRVGAPSSPFSTVGWYFGLLGLMYGSLPVLLVVVGILGVAAMAFSM